MGEEAIETYIYYRVFLIDFLSIDKFYDESCIFFHFFIPRVVLFTQGGFPSGKLRCFSEMPGMILTVSPVNYSHCSYLSLTYSSVVIRDFKLERYHRFFPLVDAVHLVLISYSRSRSHCFEDLYY